jgi:hypothetical protein
MLKEIKDAEAESEKLQLQLEAGEGDKAREREACEKRILAVESDRLIIQQQKQRLEVQLQELSQENSTLRK